MDSDPFDLERIIEKTMRGTRKGKKRNNEKINNNKSAQKARFEEWRQFVKDLNSGGKAVEGVRRGKPKGKRGRKPKITFTQLGGGDIITDSQIRACNTQVERNTCEEEARRSLIIGEKMGLIREEDGEKV